MVPSVSFKMTRLQALGSNKLKRIIAVFFLRIETIVLGSQQAGTKQENNCQSVRSVVTADRAQTSYGRVRGCAVSVPAVFLTWLVLARVLLM